MRTWVVFVAGPVIWLVHFMAVYLFVEAGCAAQIAGVSLVTLVATAAAVAASVLVAGMGYRRWRAGGATADAQPGLAFASFLLGALFALAIAFVGVPAAWLGC